MTTFSPLPRRRARRSARGLVLPLLALALAATAFSGCGEEGTSSAAAQPDDDRPTTAAYLISADDLPEGWRDSNSQGVDYRVEVCGVDIEPVSPTNATSIRFAKGPVGPFLEQHVRIYDTDVASGVIADLREALPGCTEYTVTGLGGNHPTATFDVEPLTVEGAPDNSVAWRQTSRGDLPVTADLLLVGRGEAAVMLMSYAVRGTPPRAVLERAAAALPEGE